MSPDRSAQSAAVTLLADIAGELLLRRDPTSFLDAIFRRVAAATGVDVCFHYRLHADGKLRLTACLGVDEHTASRLAELKLGEAVCGAVAEQGRRMVVDHVAERTDGRTALLRRLDVQSYVCHPLLADDEPIGTLSFGSRSRPTLGDDTLELLRAVSQLVAAAIQRTLTERALRRTEAEYRSAFEHAGVGKAECNSDGVLRRINGKLAEMLGREPAELPGTPFIELVHPDDRGSYREAMRGLLVGDHDTHQTETRYLRPDGGPLWALATTSVLRDEGGVADRILTTVQDVSDRRRVADALRASERLAREQARRLAETDRRKDEFLAVLGHELRNPLAALASGIQVLRRNVGTATDRAWALQMMEHQAGRLARLLDDLLDVSRISRGMIRLETGGIDMADVAAAAVQAVRPLYEEYAHRLTTAIHPPLPVRGDALRLEQVLVNLLTNAARYTRPGGDVQLRAERRDDVVEIAVQDNGIGLSPAATERIFEPFAQVREPGSPGGGLGIGLTLVRRLVTLHDGSVDVRSDGLGRGSTFTVRLPASDEAISTEDPPEPSRPIAASRELAVLIVDDNQDAARSLAMLLELHGFQTQVASCGQECLSVASRSRPHVVLLDLGLPDVTGYEVARRLRATHGAATPLLVAVTGYGHDEARMQTAEAGFDHHLLKPVGDKALLELLDTLRA